MNRSWLRATGAALMSLWLLAGCGPADTVAPTGTPPAPHARADAAPPPPSLDTRGLPREALATLEQIRRGGPFDHRQDGTIFHNRERRLPSQATGYYREYTVPTPGERTRGARRIVAGGQPPDVFYYTPDHYRSFVRIPEQP